jgi:lysine/ornithine N-monooxygenase
VVLNRVDAVVIGAGPAGLAASRELAARGIGHLVLERGPDVGHTWQNLYDSLVLHTGKHMSALPGLPFPRSAPLFPSRDVFVAYLRRYREQFALPVETGVEVTRVTRQHGRWRVARADGAAVEPRVLVVATGIVANPSVPCFPGHERFKGQVIHSVEYRRPDPFRGKRVLVVGAGNSANEIGGELARNGAAVTLAVRSGAFVVPRDIAGVPIQYVAFLMSPLPRPVQRAIVGLTAAVGAVVRGPSPFAKPPPTDCPDVPQIGFHLTDAIRDGLVPLKPAVAELTVDGAAFADGSAAPFDIVLLATGYRAALGFLDGLIQRDACGFARRERRVVSRDQAGLFFVGHNYDNRGGLFNIAEDARLVGRAAAEALAG